MGKIKTHKKGPVCQECNGSGVIEREVFVWGEFAGDCECICGWCEGTGIDEDAADEELHEDQQQIQEPAKLQPFESLLKKYEQLLRA